MTKVTSLFFIMFFQCSLGQNNLRLNKTEFFTVSTSVNPSGSIRESGLNIVGEIEYAGFVYAKAGFESFSGLSGSLKDIHGGMGINFTSGLFERTRYYGGIRLAKVNRGNYGFRPIYGLETGIDYTILNKFFLGIRGTLDKRYDQEIFGGKPDIKGSCFVRLGYKWFHKKS